MRKSRVTCLVVLSASIGGCLNGAGRSLGAGAAEGLASRRDSLAIVGASVVDGAGRAFADSVAPRFDTAIARITEQLEASSGRLTDTLEASLDHLTAGLEVFLTAAARDSLRTFVAGHANVLRSAITRSLEEWSATLAGELDGALRESGTRLVAALADSVSRSLAASLESGPLGTALVELGDRVVRRAVQAIDDEGERTGLSATVTRVLWIAAIVVALIAVAGVGRFVLALRREKRQSEESLRVMSYVVKQRGDQKLAEDVKALALKNGVEPYLHDFLERQRLLIDEPAATT